MRPNCQVVNVSRSNNTERTRRKILDAALSAFAAHGYAKHTEVTVPSLADWEKEWQETKKAALHRVAFLTEISSNSFIVPEFFQHANQFWQQNAF